MLKGTSLLLASLLVIPLAPSRAQTQSAMNAQSRAKLERADTKLTKTYQALLARLPATLAVAERLP